MKQSLFLPDDRHRSIGCSRPDRSRPHLNRCRSALSRGSSGMTLIELMIAFTLFAMMSLGSLSALLQTRKMSENNVAQETAAVIAQGIIEQVQLNPYDDIQNKDGTHTDLDLKFTGVDTNNLASIQQHTVHWATDATDVRTWE